MQNLGKRAKDKITGFEGIIVRKIVGLFDSNSYSIAPEAKDGKLNDTERFNEGRIEIIGEGVVPSKMRVEAALGKRAKDRVTGFEGIITGKAAYFSGANAYSIQPETKDGKPKDNVWFTEGRIEITGEGFVPSEVLAGTAVQNLGKRAKDRITGFEGIIIAKNICLFDSNDYSIAPEAKDGKLNDTERFDEFRIEIIGEGVVPYAR